MRSLIRAEYADRVCLYDKAEVQRGLAETSAPEPAVVITASAVEQAGIASHLEKGGAAIFGSNWLVPERKEAEHIGQPVAMLLFDSPSSLRSFRRWVKEGGMPVRYGPSPVQPGHGNPVTGPEQDVRRAH